MKSEVIVLLISEILGFCATTVFNRRKIFEQKEVITVFTNYIEQHLSYEVYSIIKYLK